jgi:hypothetical protein
MLEVQHPEERPCLHCMMVELIEDFFAEYPATSGEPDAIDTDEVIVALAKTVADLTCSQNSTVRQQIIEALMREIMECDAEFRREDASGAVTSAVRHWWLKKIGIAIERRNCQARLPCPVWVITWHSPKVSRSNGNGC